MVSTHTPNVAPLKAEELYQRMGEPAKEKEGIRSLRGKTNDPKRERLLDLIKAREVLAAEGGCEPMIPGLTRQKHISEMRERGASEEYITSIYESVEKE